MAQNNFQHFTYRFRYKKFSYLIPEIFESIVENGKAPGLSEKAKICTKKRLRTWAMTSHNLDIPMSVVFSKLIVHQQHSWMSFRFSIKPSWSLPADMSICLLVCLFVCLSVSLSLCLSICLFFFCLSFCLSVCLYICSPICLNVYVFVWKSVSLCLANSPSVSLSVSLSASVCLSVSLYVCMSIYLTVFHSEEGLTLDTSFINFARWPTYNIDSIVKTKLSVIPQFL